jgi:TonB-linked SusC/RagA family outer membrane protein
MRLHGQSRPPNRAGRRSHDIRAAATLLIAALLLVSASTLRAQEGTISGVVVDGSTLQPLANAQVGIDKTSVGTVTDAQGRFRLTRVPGADAVVTVSMIGFRAFKEQVRVGATNLRLGLTLAPVELNQIVITGTAGVAQKRSVGNSVGQIDAARTQAIAPASTAANLLNGRVAGVVLTPGTGMVGSGPRIKIRGSNSFSLSDQPLIYIDGIRVDNDVSVGPRAQGTSSVISRLNDINPEDIDSFEIIKGPAAATLYGTEAANGVIQIITKKGRVDGAPRADFSMRMGTSWWMNPQATMPINYGIDPTTKQIVSWDAIATENANGTPLWKNGAIQSYNANLSGGSGTTRYYIAGGFDKQDGIESINNLQRFTTRANLGLHPSNKLNASISLGYVQSKTNLPVEGSSGRGLLVNAVFGTPLFLNTPKRGFLTAPPEVLHSPDFRSSEALRRFTQSAQLTFDAFPWLSQRLSLGLDLTGEEDQALTKRDDALVAFFSASTALGSKTTTRHDVTYSTVDYTATAKEKIGANYTGASSVGVQYYRRRDQFVTATGREFPAPNLETVLATAITTGSDDFYSNTTLGVFAQQQFGWRDLAFLTGAVRVDNNSAFGSNFDFVVYPKLSGTYVISDQLGWNSKLVKTLKLRAAYGQSGQQPRSFAALRTYQPVTAGNSTSAVTPQFVGNPDLAPERGAELEGGFEAGLLDERVGVDFTFYYRKTKDAILEKATAPSLGFPGTQFVNAGAIQNKGVELQLKALAVNSRTLNLEFNANLSKNSNKVLNLGGDQYFNVVEDGTGFITPLASQRHQVGYALGAWWGKEVVGATVGSNGIATNLMCTSGNGGAPVACADAPIIMLGSATPTFEGSLSSTASFRGRIRLYALVDFKHGMMTFNNTQGYRCQTRLTCIENVDPLHSDPVRVAVAQSNRTYWNSYLQNSSFAKLREVSLAYTLPESLVRRFSASGGSITFSGRNLHTFTSYPGLDPEADFLSNQFTRTEQTNVPPLSQFTSTVRLTF